jgi:type II secretory ATPase GspE/PulE/Tfp pilus assembly ATPase PilB-like protein
MTERIDLLKLRQAIEQEEDRTLSPEAARSTEAIREAGIDKGMITLRQDGWFKVLRGITTISEVLRVTVEK